MKINMKEFFKDLSENKSNKSNWDICKAAYILMNKNTNVKYENCALKAEKCQPGLESMVEFSCIVNNEYKIFYLTEKRIIDMPTYFDKEYCIWRIKEDADGYFDNKQWDKLKNVEYNLENVSEKFRELYKN